MAEQGARSGRESEDEAALVAEREWMLGWFMTFTTWSVVGVTALLVLLAIFLL